MISIALKVITNVIYSSLLISLIFTGNKALADQTSKAGSHALSIHGTPKYPENFQHFDYVNPNAPKGGKVVLSAVGSFNSFNPFISKGVSATYLNLIYDTLTVKADDEPFSEYGLIAERIELASDRSSVTFHINPKAKFHDGKPITAEDVIFTFNLLLEKGSPHYKAYYHDVAEAEALNKSQAKFTFKTPDNRELPLILGQLNVLPKHKLEGKNFTDNLLDIPLGSGPYQIKEYQTGQTVTFIRNNDYWAKDHPANKGRYNFDEIRVEYFLDSNVALEGLKSGTFDFYQENSSKRWATQYQGPKFESGELIKEELSNENPTGMQAFVFNTRQEAFSNPKTRQAIGLVFDFEWTNKNLFYGAYKRTNSFFENSELAAKALPSDKELALLTPFKDDLPEEVFTKVYHSPKTKGDGKLRKQLRLALKLLKEAGWGFQNKLLVDKATGKPLEFEILLYSKDFERIVLPFIKNLEKIGIKATARLVDQSQYIERMRAFNFDMMIYSFRQSTSPGNEQRDYWFSGFADQKGSRNLIGIKDPAVDSLVESIVNATSREELVSACRALDRVLLWNHYVIPQWYINTYRVAYKNKFARPETPPKHDLGFFTWWIKQQ